MIVNTIINVTCISSITFIVMLLTISMLMMFHVVVTIEKTLMVTC